MVNKNLGVVVRQPFLSIVCLLLIESQIDGFVVFIILVEEPYPVSLNRLEIFLSLKAG